MDPIGQIIERHVGRRGSLLVALQEIQAAMGCISPPAIIALAKAYQVDEVQIRGVISFYRSLRTAPPGRHRLCLCRGDSCAATGAAGLAEAAERHLAIPPGSTTVDNAFTYESSYCLGNCALSPSVAIDGEVYGRVTPTSLLERLGAATAARAGQLDGPVAGSGERRHG